MAPLYNDKNEVNSCIWNKMLLRFAKFIRNSCAF